jgi:major membrane immunogen (membrane-anchored lipoprotein)
MVRKIRSISAVTALTLMLGMVSFSLSACSDDQNVLNDGYYTVMQDGEEHGWTEYVTIDVKNGKIVTTEFQAINESGLIKSWDLDYMRIMNKTDGTYPNEYVRILTQEFMEKQNADVDIVTGATNSSSRFLKLAAAVIEQAKKGDTSVLLLDTAEGEEGEAHEG